MGQCQAVEVDELIEESKWVSSVNRFLVSSPHFPPNTVWLNVYNMCLINETTSKFGLGVYHTGVEVFGEEFTFSGSHKNKSGLRRYQPGDASWLRNAYFSRSIKLGTTNLSQEEVREKFDSLHDEYHARRFSVVDRNCKHFTRDFCQEILAPEHMSYPDTLIPPFVDRIERLMAMCRCLMPKSWTMTLAEQGQQQTGFFSVVDPFSAGSPDPLIHPDPPLSSRPDSFRLAGSPDIEGREENKDLDLSMSPARYLVMGTGSS